MIVDYVNIELIIFKLNELASEMQNNIRMMQDKSGFFELIIEEDHGKVMSQHSSQKSQKNSSDSFELIVLQEKHQPNQQFKQQTLTVITNKQFLLPTLQIYNQTEWIQFYLNPKRQRKAYNSIVLMFQRKQRTIFWNNLIKPIQIEAGKQPNAKEKKHIKKAIERVKQILLSINTQLEVETLCAWTEETLLQYTAIDIQISYSKGLEYLCLGTLISHPQPTIQLLKVAFWHLTNNMKLRRIYLPGSPLYFTQLQKLEEQIKHNTPQLFERMAIANADTSKIFINYYKTMLIYKVKNIYMIRKIFQLLLVYGIELIRKIIMCILIEKSKQSFYVELSNEQLLDFLASHIIISYFDSQSEEELNIKFIQLQIFK